MPACEWRASPIARRPLTTTLRGVLDVDRAPPDAATVTGSTSSLYRVSVVLLAFAFALILPVALNVPVTRPDAKGGFPALPAPQ